MSAFLQSLTMTRVFFAVAEKQPLRPLSDLFLFTIGVFSIFSLLTKEEKNKFRANTLVTYLQISVSVFRAGFKFFTFLHLQICKSSGNKKCHLKSTSFKAARSVCTSGAVVHNFPCTVSPACSSTGCQLHSRVQGNPILPHSSLSVCSYFSSLALFQFADLFVMFPQLSTLLLNFFKVLYLFLCQFHICIMGILNLRLKIYDNIEKQTSERCAYLVNPYLPLHISHLDWF